MINAGKLAVVLGIEESEVLNCGQTNGTPKCTAAQIDSELDGLYKLGVRSLFPVHKFDNALGGTKFDGGTSGVVVNVGNKYATGQFWAANHCDVADHDNEPTNPAGQNALLAALFGPVVTNQLLSGQLPVYPPGPLCNPKGLTSLGEHLLRSMMSRGMIVETDHMSAKARQQALTILEASKYPGVISSHSLGRSGHAEAAPEARRPGGSDLERGQPVRRRVAGGPRQPRHALHLRHAVRVRHQRPPLAARAASRTRPRTR